ncbi:PepSY domain-containing protein (plasmid) [Sphingobium sp. SCG-1]|nr:PepSY domain-containing protein [Sphingobium sp. SCG-1]
MGTQRTGSDGHTAFYGAVWRWHFYAGLAVLPILLWLAVTGSLYLYKPELEAWIYRDWSEVPPAGAAMALGALVEKVDRQSGLHTVQIARPVSASESWRFKLADAHGGSHLAFVNPYDGTILGVTSDGGAMQTVRELHSLIITGKIGNMVVELCAGWAVILILSGLYLWWPRKGSLIVGLRRPLAGRRVWRDVHASVGLLSSSVILFLALTGMPWTGVAGNALQNYVAAHGFGRPPRPVSGGKEAEHEGHGNALSRASLPWSLQMAPPPHVAGDDHMGPDHIVHIAAARGLAAPWVLSLPKSGEPYVVSFVARKAEDAHILFIDGTKGQVLQEVRYDDFGSGARIIEWGIATHQGIEYGEPNRVVMLLGCLATAILCLTAPILWWKRRLGGRLRPPPRARTSDEARTVAIVMIAIGILLPLTGLSMVAILAIEFAGKKLRAAAS